MTHVRRLAFILVALVYWVICARMFAGIEVLDREYVFAHTDPSDYSKLIVGGTWSALTREDRLHARVDELDRKVVHHFGYVAVGSALFEILAPVYRLFGIPESQATYGVQALLGVINVILFGLVLRRLGTPPNVAGPLWVVYAACASTVVLASVPESWLYTGTMGLVAALLAVEDRVPDWVVAAFVGIAMNTNLLLLLLVGVMLPRAARDTTSPLVMLRRLATWAAVAFVSWAAVQQVLALAFDRQFRADWAIVIASEFRETFPTALPIYSPLRSAYAAVNLYFVSIVGNHADLAFGWRAALETLKSPFGLASALVYATVIGLCLRRVVRLARPDRRARSWTTLRRPEWTWLIMMLVMLCLAIGTVYYEGFVYSPIAIPWLLLLLAGLLREPSRLEVNLLRLLAVLVMIDTAQTVLRSREILVAM
jgi:hypothetical protein